MGVAFTNLIQQTSWMICYNYYLLHNKCCLLYKVSAYPTTADQYNRYHICVQIWIVFSMPMQAIFCSIINVVYCIESQPTPTPQSQASTSYPNSTVTGQYIILNLPQLHSHRPVHHTPTPQSQANISVSTYPNSINTGQYINLNLPQLHSHRPAYHSQPIPTPQIQASTSVSTYPNFNRYKCSYIRTYMTKPVKVNHVSIKNY